MFPKSGHVLNWKNGAVNEMGRTLHRAGRGGRWPACAIRGQWWWGSAVISGACVARNPDLEIPFSCREGAALDAVKTERRGDTVRSVLGGSPARHQARGTGGRGAGRPPSGRTRSRIELSVLGHKAD